MKRPHLPAVSGAPKWSERIELTDPRVRFWLSLLPPFAALVIQLSMWSLINPYVWFLFFPAVFASAWIGTFRGGLVATAISALLVWWFFVAPTHTFVKESPRHFFPLITFMLMGATFVVFQDMLRQAHIRTRRALDDLAEANSALSEAKDQTETLLDKALEIERLKSQFFANVSHELRTPLTLILGPTQTMLAAPGVTDDQRAHLELVDRQAHHLLRLVNELLEGSRLESGQAHPAYSTVDLAGLVRTVCAQFEAVATRHAITFTVMAPPTLPAEVDADRIQRALTNLLSNALKFTPRGGSVRAQLDKVEADAVICVADSGPGIPEGFRDVVFERFRQVENDASRRFGGTGLGLAIARDIAELHGGSLTLDDAPEGGALFRLQVPVGNPRTEPEAMLPDSDIRAAVSELLESSAVRIPVPTAERTDHAFPRPRVLVIEDNADLAGFIRESLTDRYAVEIAADGRAGLRAATRHHPDLIVCDVMMPHMTGDQVVAAVRHDPQLARVPIVVLTARADEETRIALLRAGANDFLTKPFNTAELHVRIDNLLRLKTTETHLVDALARAEGLLHASPHATIVVDGHGVIALVNRQATTMFGYSAEELVGQTVELLLPEHARDVHPSLRASFARHPHARAMGSGLDLVARRRDGMLIPVDVSLSPVDTTEGPLVIAAVRDISDQRKAQQELERLALHDALTGLPNRSLFLDRLTRAVAAADLERSCVAVFFVDVDRFKHINDTHGHDVGDQYLVGIAERLIAAVRPSDMVGRLGGDEFAIICQGLLTTSDAVALAERVMDSVRAPLAVEGHMFHPTISIGVATTSAYDAAPDELIGAADMAMYRAKTHGRDRVEVFDETLKTLADKEFSTIALIRNALDHDHVRVYYQPIVDLRDGRIVRAEALVRIDDPDRGVLTPDAFLDVAEETGLIIPIGARVVEEALRQLAQWQRAGLDRGVAVNFSARQLTDSDIESLVIEAALDAGADLHGLCIEVTETAFMDATPELLARLERLKEAGVHLAVDDFGTGWSNLRYLRNLPIDAIKIDRAFTKGIDTQPRDTAIVTAVVQLARALGMRTVVEGIETLGQAATVRALDCTYGQGFLYGRPMPARDFDELASLGSDITRAARERSE